MKKKEFGRISDSTYNYHSVSVLWTASNKAEIQKQVRNSCVEVGNGFKPFTTIKSPSLFRSRLKIKTVGRFAESPKIERQKEMHLLESAPRQKSHHASFDLQDEEKRIWSNQRFDLQLSHSLFRYWINENR
jgi:hypothetical protein